MNALIKIEPRQIGTDGAPVQTVNARDLHAFLEVGKMFAHWIKDRIEQYGFVEHHDYVVFAETGNNPSGGRPAKEYAISLDMAKELAMVERNEKGKQARMYFIECERRAKASDPMAALNDPATMRGLLLSYSEKVLALESKVQEQAPKVAALDRIATAVGSLCVTAAAKAIQMQPKRLFEWLKANGWIYRRPGGSGWLGYQTKVQSGLLEHKVTTVERSDGSEKMVEQVLITPKGLARLSEDIGVAPAAY